jgi:hypothetical protein
MIEMGDEKTEEQVPTEPITLATEENVDVQEPKAPDVWRMPEPVFRQSSGFLPKDFEKRYPVREPVADDVAAPPPVQAPEIQPQPALEDAIAPAPDPPAPAKTKNPVLGMVFGVVGLLVMAVLAIAFLLIVYFLFFYHPSESLNLN